MVNDEAAITFQKLGLSDYESRALSTLFKRHDSTALEISKDASIPYTKIYAVLSGLEKIGVIKSTLERPKRYRPLDPENVMADLLKKEKNRLSELTKVADERADFLKSIFKEGESHRGSAKIWYGATFESVWNETKDIVKKCKNNFCSMKNLYIARKLFSDEDFAQTALDALNRGVKARTILPMEASNEISNFPLIWLEYLAHPNISIRFLPEERILQNFIMADDKIVGVAYTDPGTGKGINGIRINDESAAKGSVDYFNFLWRQAAALEDQVRESAKLALSKRRNKK
jgi:sugar-specific transcriptional regulator TrmB